MADKSVASTVNNQFTSAPQAFTLILATGAVAAGNLSRTTKFKASALGLDNKGEGGGQSWIAGALAQWVSGFSMPLAMPRAVSYAR